MLRLAAPVLLEQILGMAVWFSDRLLTGHYLDTPHLAAITVMAYVLWLVWGLFSVVAIGATAMVARFVGAGDWAAARSVTHQAFIVGALLAFVITLGGTAFSSRVAIVLQLSGESAELATTYLNCVLPVVPLIMFQTVGIACLRGAGDMVSGLVIMAVVNLVNVVVSWSLVLGLGPLPELGWKGIALGTAAGFLVGGTLVMALLLRGRWGLKLQWRRFRPNRKLIRRLLRVGLPGGADMLSIIGCQLWFVSLINRLGTLAVAAHGVALCVESLAFLPGSAFQMAATTMVGQTLGARDPRRASRSAVMALLCGGGLMIMAGVVIFTRAEALAGLFVRSEHSHVADLAVPLLRTVSLAIPALAVTMILSGSLRGAGDTRWPLAFSLVSLLGVRIPLAYWLAQDVVELPLVEITIAGWGLGVVGAWYAMAADLHVRALLVTIRFLHGGWKRVEV
ncbi:MAG: MATE family efflux transporter [Thermoguttaceae bacterium]|jgi:putative MATE family efflux protein|nr:MATE family efflux transporter [Thermoguttaceae bacterium]